MSGAGVVAGDLIVGVVRSHNLAEGPQSLTVTPLTAIDLLPSDRGRPLWEALGVTDSSWHHVVDRWSERGAMDLIAVLGYYTLVAFTLNVDRHPVPGGEEPLGAA